MDAGGGWHQRWLAVVGGSRGGCQQWVVWLLVAAVVAGCDSMYGQRVLLDSVPCLTPHKKVGLKWILKAFF